MSRMCLPYRLKVHDRVQDYARDLVYVYGPRDVVAWPITGELLAAMRGVVYAARRRLEAGVTP